MPKVARAHPSVLSFNKAIADFGFLELLGGINSYLGSGAHRLVLKNELYPSLEKGDGVAQYAACISAAIDIYFPTGGADAGAAAASGAADVLPTFRRVLMHSTIAQLVGPSVLEAAPTFIEEYITFQDKLEEATAKATVLPRWLAKPLFLDHVGVLRQGLVAMLSPTIASMWAGDKEAGAWPVALKGVKRSALPGYTEFAAHVGTAAPAGDGVDSVLTSDEAADLVIGLLFAAHKNPAIGAGQTLLYLLDPAHEEYLGRVKNEVGAIKGVLCDSTVGGNADASATAAGGTGGNRLESVASKTPFLGACIAETLRLTAHSIGAVRKVVARAGIELKTEAGATYSLKQGDYVGISHIVPHRDPAVYAAPDAFNPRRFLGSGGEKLLADDYKYTTFSHGVHRCPGRKLADLQIRLTLGVLLARLDVALLGVPGAVDFERATLAQRAGPCMVQYSRK